jgi:hypothetical protein
MLDERSGELLQVAGLGVFLFPVASYRNEKNLRKAWPGYFHSPLSKAS